MPLSWVGSPRFKASTCGEVEGFLRQTAELMAAHYKVEHAEPVVLTPQEVDDLLYQDYDKDDPAKAEFKRAIRDFSG